MPFWLLAVLLLQQPQPPPQQSPPPERKKPEIVILDPNAPKGLEKEKKEEKEEPAEPGPVKEYAYNPYQAVKEVEVGDFYMKKGRYSAAAKRYEEATKWKPNWGLAYQKLAQAEEKLGQPQKAVEAYRKFLEILPRSRDAEKVRREIARLEKKKER